MFFQFWIGLSLNPLRIAKKMNFYRIIHWSKSKEDVIKTHFSPSVGLTMAKGIYKLNTWLSGGMCVSVCVCACTQLVLPLILFTLCPCRPWLPTLHPPLPLTFLLPFLLLLPAAPLPPNNFFLSFCRIVKHWLCRIRRNWFCNHAFNGAGIGNHYLY